MAAQRGPEGSPTARAPVDLGAARERARGALLGVALGDALGATTEFMTPGEIRKRFGVHRKITGGGWLRLKPGEVTDDTQLTLCVARAVVAGGGWDLPAIADQFVTWLRSRPVDVGSTCARGIRRWMHQGTLEGPPSEWDAGNGALMRTAPVALLTLGSPVAQARYAVQQAHLTHNHPLSDEACVEFGHLTQAALLGASRDELVHSIQAWTKRTPRFSVRRYDGTCSAYVVDTVRTVLHHFLTTTDFETCLVGVVNQGGDADTAGAIAGMLAGACYGPTAMPRRWLRKLRPVLREELTGLAEALIALSPAATSPNR